MNTELGMKELYDVALKATYPIEVGGKNFDKGEILVRFDKIQLANFSEKKEFLAARGGYENAPRIWWEETKEITVNITQGIFSVAQLSIIANADLLQKDEELSVSNREFLESNEKGQITLKHEPLDSVFVYNKQTGEKISILERSGKVLTIENPYQETIVDYTYNYFGGSRIITIGKTLTNGYLSLEGKMRVKDDITGHVKTGIIKIPKLKLMSDLSIRLGSDATPQVGRLSAVAVPDGARGNKRVMEMIFLNDDIDSDI